jgi:hypothetical protein
MPCSLVQTEISMPASPNTYTRIRIDVKVGVANVSIHSWALLCSLPSTTSPFMHFSDGYKVAHL